MDDFFRNQTDEQLEYIREAITREFNRREEERKPKENQIEVYNDSYSKTLFKLYCKGMITEEELEQKIAERK